MGNITIDKGELDAKEAWEFFYGLGIKISLTMAYNLDCNGKVKEKILLSSKLWPRLVKEEQVNGPKCFPMLYGLIEQHIAQ